LYSSWLAAEAEARTTRRGETGSRPGVDDRVRGFRPRMHTIRSDLKEESR
jgi:hypothetical protein